MPLRRPTGRIQLGSSFNFVQFDNLKVETVPGYTPYYTSIIDGMHQTSWADSSVPILEFDGSWSHINGQGMFEWQRTASKSTAKGAAMTYSFTGTGLDIIGTNPGTPTLDVVVDGVHRRGGGPDAAARAASGRRSSCADSRTPRTPSSSRPRTTPRSTSTRWVWSRRPPTPRRWTRRPWPPPSTR